MCWHALVVPIGVLRADGNIWAELFLQYEDAEFGLRLRAAGPAATTSCRSGVPASARPPGPKLRVARPQHCVDTPSPGKEYLTCATT